MAFRSRSCPAISSSISRRSLSLPGDEKIDTVALKEVQPLTGYIRVGVTALAAKKSYPVFADETIELFDVISVSAGVRGRSADPLARGLHSGHERKVGPIPKEK